jgi:hypothetical protein
MRGSSFIAVWMEPLAHLHGDLCGRHHLGQEDELPALQLGPVGEVQILGEGVVLPAPGCCDGGAAPDAGRAVEVEEPPRPVARGVLDDEVAVEQDALHLGEGAESAVQVLPAHLHHAHAVVGEVVHRAAEEFLGRDEVGVEHRHELAGRGQEAVLQRAGLEALAVGPVDVVDVEPLGAPVLDGPPGDERGLVERVVEDLDLEQLARIVELADRPDEPLDDVHLVEDGELDGDPGQLLVVPLRDRHVVLVAVVQVRHEVPVRPIHGEYEQDQPVGDDDRDLEGTHRFSE